MYKLKISIFFLFLLNNAIKPKTIQLIVKDIDYTIRPSYPINYDRYENIKMEAVYTSKKGKIKTKKLSPLQIVSLDVKPNTEFHVNAVLTVYPIRKGILSNCVAQKSLSKKYPINHVRYYLLIGISTRTDNPEIIFYPL